MSVLVKHSIHTIQSRLKGFFGNAEIHPHKAAPVLPVGQPVVQADSSLVQKDPVQGFRFDAAFAAVDPEQESGFRLKRRDGQSNFTYCPDKMIPILFEVGGQFLQPQIGATACNRR